ncbi:MAG: RnfABCDGE type electron transport complex subunit B [Lachnospirales bacterium]
MEIIFAILAIGGIGLVFGVILAIAGEKLKVVEDEKVTKIREALPGANCGGCGYPGCDMFAKQVAKGEAPVNGCPVSDEACVEILKDIMGSDVETSEKTVAFVRCGGNNGVSAKKYIYYGMYDCNASNIIAGNGSKACSYGCLGRGSCEKECAFGAIEILDGIAVINKEKCTSCGKCVEACPKDLIDIVPYNKTIKVNCKSTDAGKFVRSACQRGCIGCKLCVKACEYDAIYFENNLAKINYEKCTECGACEVKCPTKAIIIDK